MIQVTAQAASAIALRNAVFRVVPRALVEPLLADIRQAALGKGTLESKRRAMLEYAGDKTKISEAQVLQILGKRRIEDIGAEEILIMRGLFTALRDGEVTVEDLLNRGKPKATAPSTALDDTPPEQAAGPEGEEVL
jgi:hypothetical protein